MENILQTADRLFQNRYIISIKKAFTITLPVIILGSIASLINNIPINIVQMGLSTPVGQVIRAVNSAIWLGSTAVMAILIAWTLGYYLGNTYKLNGTLSALTSVSSYLTICVTTSDGGISLSQLGSSGLFGAILIAILATELYHAFSNLKINISEDTAEEVRQMFAALLPVMLSVFCIALTNGILLMTSGKGVDEWIYTALSLLFSAADGGGLAGTLFLVFGIHIFWFFGIHGGNVMDSIMVSAFGENLIRNTDLYALDHNAFDEHLAIISKGFLDTFVFMGGAGTSLCIIIAVFIIARSRYMRSIAKMGGVFALFNMNEIVLFGFPVILNPILLIPFLLTPLTITLVSWSAMSLGLVARVVTEVHWAMPPLISGYLATGGHLSGSILQVINIAAGILIYLPFIRLMDRRAVQKEALKDDNTVLLKNTLNTVIEKIHNSTGEVNGEITDFSIVLESVVRDLNVLSAQMQQQMQVMHTCDEYMRTIDTSVGNTDTSIKTVLQNLEKTNTLSTTGAQNLQQTMQEMEEAFFSTQKTNELASQLNLRCEQIEGMLKSIEDISVQTTTLSRSASIEATHADVHGKEFSVAAANIKDLSEATAKAVSDIEGLLQGMKADTSDMIERSEVSFKRVETGLQQVIDANRLFGEIVQNIHNIQVQCHTVLKYNGEVIDELQQINEQIQTTSHFFEETASHTSKVAAQVRNRSDESKEMAHKLRKLNVETSLMTVNALENLES
ncbi:PTS transporter subunit EIIC [Acetatifactor muris]|uniref:PTS transporter subunit EIIC n=1 Tax=Acetatifactor muris TaxID=879566 RepID=UPI0023F1D380|nr:PTS transporter subunit EIIC [Acetatifactor muris]